MAKRRSRGLWLVILASLIGLGLSLYNYAAPATGIDGTGGALLVILSTALMLIAAIAVGRMRRGVVSAILLFLILLDIIGTAGAAWLLESDLLLAAMTLAAVGWLLRLIAPPAKRMLP